MSHEALSVQSPVDVDVGSLEAAYLRTMSALQEVARNAPYVTQEWITNVASMDPMDMRRRLIRNYDWHGHFAHSLDGIPEVQSMPGGGIDGCRTHTEVRAIVLGLLRQIGRRRAFAMLHYLASPYNHPDPAIMESRRVAACRKVGELISRGVAVLSPIAHNVAVIHEVGGETGWDRWHAQDLAMLSACQKLLVLCLPGWEASTGVSAEISAATSMGIPIEYIDP